MHISRREWMTGKLRLNTYSDHSKKWRRGVPNVIRHRNVSNSSRTSGECHHSFIHVHAKWRWRVRCAASPAKDESSSGEHRIWLSGGHIRMSQKDQREIRSFFSCMPGVYLSDLIKFFDLSGRAPSSGRLNSHLRSTFSHSLRFFVPLWVISPIHPSHAAACILNISWAVFSHLQPELTSYSLLSECLLLCCIQTKKKCVRDFVSCRLLQNGLYAEEKSKKFPTIYDETRGTRQQEKIHFAECVRRERGRE